MLNKKNTIELSTVLYSIAILIVLYLIFIAVALYGFGSENRLVKKTLQYLPYPAAFVGKTNYIYVNDLEKDLVSVRKFYESQDFSNLGYRVDFSTENGIKRLKVKEKRLLNKLIENKVIAILSKQRDIRVDPELISQEIDKRIEQYGNEDEISKKLEKMYGWNLDDFKEKVVKPDMYIDALKKDIRDNSSESLAAKTKIEKALGELNNGGDFAEIANKYSDGESAKNGGELGWLSVDQMIPEIALTATLLEKGKTSNVLESSLGYHIINVEGKKVQDNETLMQIRQIFVRVTDFSDWLTEQEKNIKIRIPLKDFYWDDEIKTVRFKDKMLDEFENNLEENSFGDASIIF